MSNRWYAEMQLGPVTDPDLVAELDRIVDDGYGYSSNDPFFRELGTVLASRLERSDAAGGFYDFVDEEAAEGLASLYTIFEGLKERGIPFVAHDEGAGAYGEVDEQVRWQPGMERLSRTEISRTEPVVTATVFENLLRTAPDNDTVVARLRQHFEDAGVELG